MIFAFTASTLGVMVAIVAGVMCGAFALPMKYLGRWSWESVWAIFILVSCVLMPAVIASATIPGFVAILQAAPATAIAAAVMAGFAWGFGAIMFGQGVSALGVSMANTLVLAISASLGSLLPMWVLAPEKLHHPQGHAILVGAIVGLLGIACCGYAGVLRENSQKSEKDHVRGSMVGVARPVTVGLALCLVAGLLSAILNVGYSLARPLSAAAVRSGYSPFSGSNLIWLLMLTSGAVPNLCFCGYLLWKNTTWKDFALPKSSIFYSLAVLMGLLWGGELFLYGYASSKIGNLGPAIGWPLKLIAGLMTANVAGYFTGEWKRTHPRDRRWMASGLVILLIAIAILARATTLD